MEQRAFGLAVTTALSFEETERRVREALAAEGFGILTEIDVATTLKAKLGVERGPYVILGACNPPLAHRAMEIDEDIGLLLPCNVVVYRAGDRTVVVALEPMTMTKLVTNPDLEPVATEARARLERALRTVEASAE